MNTPTHTAEKIASDFGLTVAEVREAINALNLAPALTRTSERFNDAQAQAIVGELSRRQTAPPPTRVVLTSKPRMIAMVDRTKRPAISTTNSITGSHRGRKAK